MHSAAPNCTALHCTRLHCTAMHHTALHYTAFYHIAMHCTTLALYFSYLNCTLPLYRVTALAYTCCLTWVTALPGHNVSSFIYNYLFNGD